VAILRIPRIELDMVVVEGSDRDNLKKGPGHYPNTALPWEESGRVAIAGHRTTYGQPFWSLEDLRRGDLIRLVTEFGTFDYRVTRLTEVSPTDSWVLEQTDRPTLVLTTCTPRFTAARRLIVFAER
jgi:sortase A